MVSARFLANINIFGNTQNAEQIRAEFLHSGGRFAGIAECLNIGTRAKLKNALARLDKFDPIPKNGQALKDFYNAFNARAKDVTTEASGAEVLRALLGTHAKSVMPELAKMAIRDEANSQAVLSMNLLEVPAHLSSKVKELAPMFGGLFAARTARQQLLPIAKEEFANNGFADSLANEEAIVETAGSPDNTAVQVAMRHSAKRDGLHEARRTLADKAGAYSSTGSQFAASVAKSNESADQRSVAAVTRLEQSGISSVSSLIAKIEKLIEAVEKNDKVSSGTVSTELSKVRNDLNGLLKALQKDSFTIEDVRVFIKASDRVLSTLGTMLDNKKGVFSTIDDKQFFRVLGSERSQVEKGIVFLKREVKVAQEKVQSFDYFKASAKAQEAARKTAHEDVNTLRGQVAAEEGFFSRSERKQFQTLQAQYEGELRGRMTAVNNVRQCLHVPTTTETLIGMTKTAFKVVVVVAAAAAFYNHSSYVKDGVGNGISYLPEFMANGVRFIARPVLDLETSAFTAASSHVESAVTYVKESPHVQAVVAYATPYLNTAQEAIVKGVSSATAAAWDLYGKVFGSSTISAPVTAPTNGTGP